MMALVFFACTGSSCAEEKHDAVTPDALVLGRHLAQECASCHRGASANAAIPALSGRPATELAGLLDEYRTGRRTNPVMVSVAQSLDDAQIAALAAYLSSLPVK
jgi:cytochrome c553